MQSRTPSPGQSSTHAPSQLEYTSARNHGDVTAQPSSTGSRSGTPSRASPGAGDQEAAAPALSGQLATRLRPPLTASPSSRNRIEEYENTPISSKPKKKNGGPLFDVIKKRGGTSDGGSQLLGLPNEVLMHTFANLSPSDLTSVSLVSRRLHELVTTQHAWRAAFSRFFPGSDALHPSFDADDDYEEEQDAFITSKRDFTRLTALASWRSEYILRTRLLRSLARGKPVQASLQPNAPRSAQSHTASPITLYNSQLFTTVNHIHANFGTTINKRLPTFIHGCDDMGVATMSDPSSGKVQNWGLVDPTILNQFADRLIGEAPYGLGAAQVVGVPNSMDVSALHGVVAGEGLPGGRIYFRFPEEVRGRFLALSQGASFFDIGMPKISAQKEAHCSVWIAKTSVIPSMTDGMIGLMSGSSSGMLSAYSLGSISGRESRWTRGEMTARWVICPGVPIISICVDEHYSLGRLGHGRIWATVLNALGEVYCLSALPKQPGEAARPSHSDPSRSERLAWGTGRTVHWSLVEPTRRVARPDPYGESSVDGGYTPQSSWSKMYLSTEQLHAEARELEAFLAKKPIDIQSRCFGWDMRRRLEVDFAHDEGNGIGEIVLVVSTGQDEGTEAAIKRYVRVRPQPDDDEITPETTPVLAPVAPVKRQASLFGGVTDPTATQDSNDGLDEHTSVQKPAIKKRKSMDEEWRTSTLTFNGLKGVQITTSTLDQSTFAISNAVEDPLFTISGTSSTASPTLTPMSGDREAAHSQDVPGQRARLLAVGTSLGTILVFNARAAIPSTSESTTSIDPMRIIHTDSPAISCLGLSSLYLVSGGTDGLVQAWDPLASSSTPVRTLHSRFSSRARRRLAQAAASPQGVGINLFAAGAIALDPDPTVLRGLVSLGTHLLYWHFSGSAADAYRSHKRRLRRSERMSNGTPEKYVPVPRGGGVKRFIENERWDLHADEFREKQEHARMAGRYGTDLLGESATEEDMVAYAALLSQEAYQADEERRQSLTPQGKGVSSRASPAPDSRRTPLRQSSVAEPITVPDEYDADLEEAIRQSLAAAETPMTENSDYYDSAEPEFGIPIKYAKSKKRTPRDSPRPATAARTVTSESASTREKDELDFALQVSLAEEQSRREAEAEWEHVEHPSAKGKGKAQAWS